MKYNLAHCYPLLHTLYNNNINVRTTLNNNFIVLFFCVSDDSSDHVKFPEETYLFLITR